MSNSCWDKPIYKHLNELFIQPFTEQLIEKYPEKTLEHHDTVNLFVAYLSARQLDLRTVRFIDPLIAESPSRRDLLVNSLESLWKVYHNQVDLKSVFPEEAAKPSLAYVSKKFCSDKIQEIISKYYGEFTPTDRYQNTRDLSHKERQTLRSLKRDLVQLLSANGQYPVVYSKVLELKLEYLNHCLVEPAQLVPRKPNSNQLYIHHADLSNRNFQERLLNWDAAGSSFRMAKFHGEGHTGHCIHWYVSNCDFTDAQFTGKICNKTSTYDGANFTRVNLTPLMYNCSECSFLNCDLTDAYVLTPLPWSDEGKKILSEGGQLTRLMGRELVRYLAEEQRRPVEGCYYHSPKDSGYCSDDLDDRIWCENADDSSSEEEESTESESPSITATSDSDSDSTEYSASKSLDDDELAAEKLRLIAKITELTSDQVKALRKFLDNMSECN